MNEPARSQDTEPPMHRFGRKIGEALETCFRAVGSPLQIHWAGHIPIIRMPDGVVGLFVNGSPDDPVFSPVVLKDFEAWIGSPTAREERTFDVLPLAACSGNHIKC